MNLHATSRRSYGDNVASMALAPDLISTQAVAVERAVLEFSNVLRAVLVLINAFALHTAGLRGALIGCQGVHVLCLLGAGGTTGLGLLQVATFECCPKSRLLFILVGGCLVVV